MDDNIEVVPLDTGTAVIYWGLAIGIIGGYIYKLIVG